MYLTGFADEAAPDIEGQIRATQELGWQFLEARDVDGANIHDIPQAKFEEVLGKFQDAGVEVNCFGSAIANWGKQISDPFDVTLEEVARAIPRMQRLGTKLIRIMSYAVLRYRDTDDQMEEERFRRLRILQQRFADAGITAVHENCMNYGGMSWQHTRRLVENVPGLKLAFDTGNPVFSQDRAKPKPYPRQSAWEFYRHVKEHIVYVHVKDGRFVAESEGLFPEVEYTFPGEGDGDVRRILADLLESGYDGGLSIEPHLAVVPHDRSVTSPQEQRYRNYIEYGRRLEWIITEIRARGQKAGENLS
jgi:sugar phosphate isomerase/epimerase